jgi:two-component sensor histidine kinase
MQSISGRKGPPPGGDQAPAPTAFAIARSLEHVGGGMLGLDEACRIIWVVGRPFDLDLDDQRGRDIHDTLPAACAESLRKEIGWTVDHAASRRAEIDCMGADGLRHYEIWLDAESAAGGGRCVAITAIDTTERRHLEQTLRTLLREVAHRSKNLLAIIQSVANQTGRYSGTIDEFLTRFRGRIQSMASSQDLITSTNWRGTGFHDLIRAQVVRYVADAGRAVRISGPDLSLNPNAALHLGLALHELVVNSVCYGRLSDPDGSVDISVRPLDGAASSAVVMEWKERLTSRPAETRVKRFGSSTLERVVPAALSGTAELSVGEDQLCYSLVIPAGNFATAD